MKFAKTIFKILIFFNFFILSEVYCFDTYEMAYGLKFEKWKEEEDIRYGTGLFLRKTVFAGNVGWVAKAHVVSILPHVGIGAGYRLGTDYYIEFDALASWYFVTPAIEGSIVLGRKISSFVFNFVINYPSPVGQFVFATYFGIVL